MRKRAEAAVVHRKIRDIFVVVVIASSAVGCVPFAPIVPFHFNETAESLPRGNVAISAGGGGGGTVFEGGGGGGALRVRVGVGARQELSAEGTVVYVDAADPEDENLKKSFRGLAGNGKLRWKISVTDYWAFELGIGAAHAITGTAIGGDLALLLSWPRAMGKVWRPYGGLRWFVSAPVRSPRDLDINPVMGLAFAAGSAFELGSRTRIYSELGMVAAFGNGDHSGYYGAVSVEVRLGKKR